MADERSWDTADKVASLRERALALDIDALFLDDATLQRFLRARQGEVAKAADMLVSHQAWRLASTPRWPLASVDPSSVPTLATGKSYARGYDREGRPVLWVRASMHDASGDAAELNRFIILQTDELVARLDRANPSGRVPSQFTLVIDLDGFGRANFDVEAAKAILTILGRNFPERLGHLLIVRNGWLFGLLWKAISFLLDERTNRKIRMLGGDISSLHEFIEPAVIPTWLGGGDAFEFAPAYITGALGVPSEYASIRDGPRAHLPPVVGSKIVASLTAGAPAVPAAAGGAGH